jgi:hypothetical protein
MLEEKERISRDEKGPSLDALSASGTGVLKFIAGIPLSPGTVKMMSPTVLSLSQRVTLTEPSLLFCLTSSTLENTNSSKFTSSTSL